MISAKQIRAARALLAINQNDLAKMIGSSGRAIMQIERALVRPHPSTLEKITTVLENEGIAFLGDDGVRLKNDVLESKIFDGETGPALFLDHIIRSLKSVPEEGRIVYWMGDNNRATFKNSSALFNYYKRLIKIKAKEKILTNKTARIFYGPPQTTEYFLYHGHEYPIDREKNLGQIVYPPHFFTLHNYKKFHVMENKAFFTASQRSIKSTCRDSTPITPERILYFEDLEKWG